MLLSESLDLNFFHFSYASVTSYHLLLCLAYRCSNIESSFLLLLPNWKVSRWYWEPSILILDDHSFRHELTKNICSFLDHIFFCLCNFQLSLQVINLMNALFNFSLLSQSFNLILFDLSIWSSPLGSYFEHVSTDSLAH